MAVFENVSLEEFDNTFLQKVKDSSKEVIFNLELKNDMVYSMKSWLSRADKLEQHFHDEEKAIEKARVKEQSLQRDILDSVRALKADHELVRKLTGLEDLAAFYIEGYETLHRIREVLTKQEITYRILISHKEKGKEVFREVNLTLDQLLSLGGEGFEMAINSLDESATRENAIVTSLTSLRITNANAKKLAENSIWADIDEEERKKRDVLRFPKFWQGLLTVRDAIPEFHDHSTYNLGRLYEVYTWYVEESKPQPFKDKTPRKPYKSIAEKIRATRGENVGGWKQGDYRWTQLKAVYNSNAGLISGSTLKTLFKKLIEVFETSPNEEALTKGLTEIFAPSKSEVHSKIEKEMAAETEERIEEIVHNANLYIEI